MPMVCHATRGCARMSPATIKVRIRIASPRNVPQSAGVASFKMFPLPHAAPERQPNSSILLFDPRREHSFVPTSSAYRPSRAAAVKDGRSCGHPKGSSLTAASTMAASSGSGLGGVHGATCWPALLASADVPKMSSCAICPRHILSRRCKVRSWPSGYEPGY